MYFILFRTHQPDITQDILIKHPMKGEAFPKKKRENNCSLEEIICLGVLQCQIDRKSLEKLQKVKLENYPSMNDSSTQTKNLNLNILRYHKTHSCSICTNKSIEKYFSSKKLLLLLLLSMD